MGPELNPSKSTGPSIDNTSHNCARTEFYGPADGGKNGAYGERGLVLEQERVERTDAIRECISKAWEQDSSGLQPGKLVSAIRNGTDGNVRVRPVIIPRRPSRLTQTFFLADRDWFGIYIAV